MKKGLAWGTSAVRCWNRYFAIRLTHTLMLYNGAWQSSYRSADAIKREVITVNLKERFIAWAGCSMSQHVGYILRIAGKELADHVFDMAIYYTNLSRKWGSGQVILFVSKSELGDAFIGYGVIGRVLAKDALSDQERIECERGGWKVAIEFKYVGKLERPLLVKETFLKNSKLRGRFFHGLQLEREQVEDVLKQAAA